MNINRLSVPVNKTAAFVVNQSGCREETTYIKTVNKIEDVKLALKANQEIIDNCECKTQKRKYGRKRQELQSLLAPLKAKVKLLNMQKRESMNSLIIRECIELFTTEEWEVIISRANSKFRASEV